MPSHTFCIFDPPPPPCPTEAPFKVPSVVTVPEKVPVVPETAPENVPVVPETAPVKAPVVPVNPALKATEPVNVPPLGGTANVFEDAPYAITEILWVFVGAVWK